jgi:hypothetical protein
MSGRLRLRTSSTLHGVVFQKIPDLLQAFWRRLVFAFLGQGSRDEVHSAGTKEPNLIGARQLHELAGQGVQLPPPAVKFTDENGGGPGVRLRKRQRAKQSK